ARGADPGLARGADGSASGIAVVCDAVAVLVDSVADLGRGRIPRVVVDRAVALAAVEGVPVEIGEVVVRRVVRGRGDRAARRGRVVVRPAGSGRATPPDALRAYRVGGFVADAVRRVRIDARAV